MNQTAAKVDYMDTPETSQNDLQAQSIDRLVGKYTDKVLDSLNTAELIETESRGDYKGFPKGVSGNPAGRPKGSLNRIQAMFYDDLYADWQSHGIQAIEKLRLVSPTKYCQLVASILPKAIQIETDGVQWVINAQPGYSSTSDWLAAHGLTRTDTQIIEDTSD